MPVSAAVFMLLLLVASSLVAMTQREAHREARRTAAVAAKPSPSDLLLTRANDVWGGQQYPVVWVEPATEAEAVLPPGVPRLPRQGQAVISPGLARLASQDSGLAARYPDHLVLDPGGVRSADELFAYVRMPEGRDLAGGQATVRVQGFGHLPAGGRTLPLTLEPSQVTVTSVSAGVVGFLVLPGLIVLVVGLAAASGVRDRRFGILRSIGAPRRTLLALAVLEAAILAVPGLVAACILWSAVGGRLLGGAPLVESVVLGDDLSLPWWLVFAEFSAGVAAVGLAAIAVAEVRSRRGIERPQPSPAPQGSSVTLTRLVPLMFAFVAFVLGESLHGDLAGTFNLIGILAAIVGVPLALPGALREVGTFLGRLRPVAVSIAGRSLQWDPVRATRPFAGAAALVVIATSAVGYIALARDVEAAPVRDYGTRTVDVRWVDPRPNDPARLANALGTAIIVPIRVDANTLTVGANCRQLAPRFGGAPCEHRSPFGLPGDVARQLEESVFGYPTGTKVRLVPEGEVSGSGEALVLDDESLQSLEERVRTAAMRALPAPYVSSALSSQMSPSPLVPWLVGGIYAAAIVLTVGCLASLVDRFLMAREHHRHLLNLGMSPSQFTVLEASLFAVPYCVVVGISFLAGLLICANIVGVFSDVSMPWGNLGLLALIAAITGFLGAACASLLGATSALTSRE